MSAAAARTDTDETSGWLAYARRELLHRPDQNLAALDGMRAVASIMVLTYHVGLLTGVFTPGSDLSQRTAFFRTVVNGCWGGIDIYFVLSGFLIGRMLMADLGRDGILHYPAFFVRRGCRIFPAYYLILVFSLFFCLLDLPVFTYLYGTRDAGELWRWSWTNFLYVVNYVNPPPHGVSIMSWAWSLSVEEHVYLLLPPLLWSIYRWIPRGGRLYALVACVLLPFAGRVVQYIADPSVTILSGIYYYSHNRFDEIFVGVLIAGLYVEHREPLRHFVRRAGHAVWILALLLVGYPWVFGGLHGGGVFVIVFQFAFLALSTGLLLLNGLFQDNWVTRLLARPFWYPIARVSYGNYLLHPFVLFILLHFYYQTPGLPPLGNSVLFILAIVTMAITSVLAALMYLCFEAPVLAWGAGWSRRLRQKQRARHGLA